MKRRLRSRGVDLLWAVILTVVAALPALAAPSGPVEQPLLSGWRFKLADGDPAASAHPEATVWRRAEVPGTVQTDLLAAGLIADPYKGDNEARLQWIGLADWTYALDFEVDAAMLAREHVELLFDGLDTFADVRLNGTLLLAADNMYRHWRLPAKTLLRPGTNKLTVAFHSPIRRVLPWLLKQPYALPGAYDSAFGDEPKGVATSTYVRKAPYQYGWDWGPRFVTEGLWQPVRLESWNGLRIAELHVQQQHVDADAARLVAEIDVEATVGGPARVRVDVTPPDGGAPFAVEQQVVLDAGSNSVALPLRVAHPQRWFPVDYGAQAMYRFHASVEQGGVVVSAERRTGLRSVELRRDKDAWGRGFAFVVNGIPIFAKGANMIPLDMFPNRVTPERHRALLLSARDAHMNMLRLWGGGYYESDDFYEQADDLGLLIWQDFMFGGAILPADAAFRDAARVEASEQVRRLRDHPSIVLWCGNNEVQADWESWDATLAFKTRISPEERERLWAGNLLLFGDVLRSVVARYAPDVPYWATSPGNDLEGASNQEADGDFHLWSVWGGSQPVETYLDHTPRFLSEYGLQSMPSMQAIRSFAEPGDLRLDAPVMRAHQKFGLAAGPDVGYDRLLFYIRKNYGEPKDFASFVYLSQVMQAEGIELAASHMRSERPRAMGTMFWQLNDVWPGASWSSIDALGRWKALQFHARRFYAPVTLTALRHDGSTHVTVVSDRAVPLKGELTLRVMDFSGRLLHTERQPVDVDALGARPVMALTDAALLHGGDPARTVAAFTLQVAGEPSVRQLVLFSNARDAVLDDPGLQTELSRDANGVWLTLRTLRLARAVWIDFGSAAALPNDNAFDLLPGEERRISIHGDADLRTLSRTLNVRSLSGTSLTR